jgi:hypothetical protein
LEGWRGRKNGGYGRDGGVERVSTEKWRVEGDEEWSEWSVWRGWRGGEGDEWRSWKKTGSTVGIKKNFSISCRLFFTNFLT